MQYKTVEPILSAYQFNYDIMKLAINAIKAPNVLANDINTVIMDLVGSRFSAKTVQTIRLWCIEFPILCKQEGLNVAINVVRNEPQGAIETFDEVLSVAEDIYGIDVNRTNSNITKKTFEIGNGTIRGIGIMSNRKKKTPKLGLARKGAKKDIEVNIFDEITELQDEKSYSLVNQATGGAKFNIRIRIANPWIMANWFIKSVATNVGFNEKLLRTNGQIFKSKLHKEEKRLYVGLINNHRINTYLSEAQHAELTGVWKYDEALARVVDLGMPGVAEGLVYAPVLPHCKEPMKSMRVKEFKAGLDWGQSTGQNGSATALLIGRIGHDFSFVAIDDEYYHHNKDHYKNEDEVIQEIVSKLIDYCKLHYEEIMQTETKKLEVAYDYMAFLLGKALKTELELRSKDSFMYVKLIKIKECYKYDVPVRIDVVKQLMAVGRYYINKENCKKYMWELENCMWAETEMVKGRPTREKVDDHLLDAGDYLIGTDLPKLISQKTAMYNKLFRQVQQMANGV